MLAHEGGKFRKMGKKTALRRGQNCVLGLGGEKQSLKPLGGASWGATVIWYGERNPQNRFCHRVMVRVGITDEKCRIGHLPSTVLLLWLLLLLLLYDLIF